MSFADQDLLQDFLTEAGDMLADVDRKLVELEGHPSDGALLNDIFRGFHTIKGGAGFLNAQALVDICHRTENLFDQLRAGKQSLSPEMLDTILAATGEVRRMFDEMGGGREPAATDDALLAALSDWAQGKAPAAAPVAVPTPANIAAPRDGAVSAAGHDALPAVDGALAGEPDWNALYAAVLGLPAPAPAPAATPVAEAPAAPVAPRPAPAPERKAPTPVSAAKENTLRVDVARFDQILNLSGEIGLTKNRLVCLRSELVARHPGDETLKQLDKLVSHLATMVGNLQNSVMKARMQPVGRMFQKYVRMTRDLGRGLGKDIELVIEGESTEIDKTMLEELNDPLVHLLRNAVDHGVDSPEERAAAGKPAKSSVRLVARQVGDAIQIEVEDDGRGMRPDVLRRKVVEKGLMTPAEAGTLDDRQALDLIFLPGFSTKTDVSDVSGRGVGMDVVKTNIQRLNGAIDISSRPGHGTKISIRLPLTLAILPVLMFRLQQQSYAIPLVVVREIIRLDAQRAQRVGGHPTYIVRGEALPVIDTAALLGRGSDRGDIGIVIQFGHQLLILAVDSFVGQDEVVIKALEGFRPRGVAGATLASDGALVLVLDLSELLREVTMRTAA